ncbi:MAG: hypothetical protein JNL70_18105 [Saprospiraceae bacterium]|nr:hypothetical protein [Saprospiraceae bacterium]
MKKTLFKNGQLSWKLAFLLLVLSMFTHCIKENEVPAYLYIPSFSMSTSAGQGTSAQKITDAWVYVDGLVQGIYQLPVQFPVVNLGKHDIQVFPGIRNNGIRSNPVINPFLTSFKVTMDLKSGKIDTIRPSTSYISGTVFKIVEDFENGNTLTVDRDNAPNFRFGQLPEGFEGKCAGLTMTKTNSYFEKALSAKVALPDNSQNIYIEMHYKTEAPIAVGIFGTSATNSIGATAYKVTLFPSATWNKTYINLTTEAKDLKMTDFQIVFKSLLPDSISTAKMLIDNIKLLQR